MATYWEDEAWSIDGSALNRFSHGISAVDDAGPALRGRWRGGASRVGLMHRPLLAGSRRIALRMFVSDMDDAGGEQSDQLATLNDNRNQLMQILRPGHRAQRTFTREMVTTSSTLTLNATGSVQKVNPIRRDEKGFYTLALVAEIELDYPWWWTAAAADDGNTGTFNLSNAGSVETDLVVVTFNGTLVNPSVTNNTTGAVLSYTGTITSPATVTVDCQAGTATHSVDGSVSGNIGYQAGGDGRWFPLDPGTNSVTLAADSGAGDVDFDIKSTYL